MRPKGSQRELEQRRLRAIELFASGVPHAAVAKILGVSQRSIRRWCALLKSGGPAALKLKPTPGRPRKLNAIDETKLRLLLCQGPAVAGVATTTWTISQIAHLIAERFGVRYHVDHVGRLLQTLGWTLSDLNRQLLNQKRCVSQLDCSEEDIGAESTQHVPAPV